MMIQWWQMQGYGVYIWSAYALVFGVLAYHAYRAKLRAKQVIQRLSQWFDGQ